jgi:hypothetical protein
MFADEDIEEKEQTVSLDRDHVIQYAYAYGLCLISQLVLAYWIAVGGEERSIFESTLRILGQYRRPRGQDHSKRIDGEQAQEWESSATY